MLNKKEKDKLEKDMAIKKSKLKPEEQLRYERKISKERECKNKSERTLQSALKEIDILEQKVNIYEDLSNRKYEEMVIKPRYGHHTSVATALFMFSDFHVEEKVVAAAVNYLNEYNPDIARKRIINAFERGLRLVEIQRHGVKIEDLVLALLGDIISGYIHPELQETNFMSPIKAIWFAQELIVTGINYLLKNGKFKKILIPCSVGNHGRSTEKRRVSNEVDTSFEWLLYKNLEREFKNEERIQFQIADGYHNYVNVYGLDIRLHHGQSIKYNGGISGIFTSAFKAIDNWNTAMKCYLDAFGHHHTSYDGGIFLSNGSVIGYNPFAISIKAKYEPPSQTFALIDNKRGVTFRSRIFVADESEKYNKRIIK